MIPTSIIRIWFLGLFSWVLLGAGIYLGHKWYQHAWSYDFNLQRSYFRSAHSHETLSLFVVACLFLWVLVGGVEELSETKNQTSVVVEMCQRSGCDEAFCGK